MFAISPTDLNWFSFLKAKGLQSRVNFWTPTPWNVAKLTSGERLYFMLKSPIRKIGGFGEFVEYKNLNINQAWNEFGFRNGCTSKAELIERLDNYKGKNSTDNRSVLDSQIGCIALDNVEFWDNEAFIDLENYPIDFSRYIVKIKYYNKEDILGGISGLPPEEFELVPETTAKLKKSRLVTERKGAGIFRAKVANAYSNTCCITEEKTVELLEAAHIQPYLNNDSNHVRNGLLMRNDFHKLYDNGLMYINEDFRVQISPKVESAYYRSFNNKEISLPINKMFIPSKEALLSRKFEFRNG